MTQVDLAPDEIEALLMAHEIKDGAWSDETIDRAEELQDALAQAEDKLAQVIRRPD